jgi:hypothetical protein
MLEQILLYKLLLNYYYQVKNKTIYKIELIKLHLNKL